MGRSLLLDQTAWDLVLDAGGNLAVAEDPYATAQDVACVLRTFKGECYFDTTVGVPYWQRVFGQFPSAPVLKALLENAAEQVTAVTSATAYLSFDRTTRALSGQVQVTTAAGTTTVINGAFAPMPPPGSSWPAGQFNFSDSRQSGWAPFA